MSANQTFDPFNNRLCRDIRNNLSKNLILSLSQGSMEPVNTSAEQFLISGLEPFRREYIKKRLIKYANVLTLVQTHKLQSPYPIALLIWDEELFFEVHEYLEGYWMKADGNEKLILQAMIRAAGTYVHLLRGNMVGAKKMGAKAVVALEQNKRLLPSILNSELLLEKLKALDPIPPKLFS